MWEHFTSLVGRCGAKVLALHSATTFSMVRELAIPLLVYLGTRWQAAGWRNWREGLRLMGVWREIRSVFFTIGLLLALTVFIFLLVLPSVIYQDHSDLVSANNNLRKAAKKLAGDVKDVELERDRLKELNGTLAAKLSAQRNPISTVNVSPGAAYSTHQQGGITAGTVINNGPPPLAMTASENVVASDKEGFIKTIITVVPNIPVVAPTAVALELDNPISMIGFWVAGAAMIQGGGPSRIGTHALISVGTSFSPQHALLITVYSALPVKLIRPPSLE